MDDIQGDFDRYEDCHNGRQYKIEAEAAFQRNMFKKSAGLDKAFDAYSRRNKMLTSMRNGTYKPSNKADAGKIAYTVALQLFNVAQTSLFVFVGLWPIALLTIPAIIVANYYFLHKDRGH